MGDLLDLSARIIDSGVTDQPVNRVTNELSELADDLAIVESFSHSVAVRTDDGIVAFDASGVHTGEAVVQALRAWRPDPVSHLVYTHGHADHVGGSTFFAAAAERDGHRRPTVIGHQNVQTRLDRYALTNNWNLIINARQFGGVPGELNLSIGDIDGGATVAANPYVRRFLPLGTMAPDHLVGDVSTWTIGGRTIELHHARGETDDHLWSWFPDTRWVMTGDFLIWNFPNAGNPQKVQRYPIEWAAALRAIIAKEPELLVPAHGLPITGRDRIAHVLDDVATALEQLVDQVIEMMNAGATLDTIVHTVRVPADTLAKPYLRPFYDEPEFVVHNVWRQFGGWWDGAASRLKPSPDAHLAQAIADLAGGTDVVMRRAERAASDGPAVHGARAAIYLQRRQDERSLMSKGIFAAAARESQIVVEGAAGA
jgi:alkyl sulfatase BDS1-like metallo-beta-lactamase superfamily hydrolase